MPGAGRTTKAVEMKHFGLCSHNKIIFPENSVAGRALGAVQPGEKSFKINRSIAKCVLYSTVTYCNT